MGDIDALLRGVNAGADSKENDEELVNDMNKLTTLVEMLVSQMEDFIIEIHVSPMCILNTKLKDIKRLEFHILYNWNLSLDEVQQKKRECQELFNSLLDGEFDDIHGIQSIKFYNRDAFEDPAIQLYSIFTDFDLEKEICDDNIYLWLYDFVKDGNYAISLPYAFSHEITKSIIFHCKTPTEIAKLHRLKQEDGPKAWYKIDEYILNHQYYSGVVYTTMLSTNKLKYALPYYYVTVDSFNSERIETIKYKKDINVIK